MSSAGRLVRSGRRWLLLALACGVPMMVMEKLAAVLDEHATFPAVEKLDLLRRTVFCFLTGNEDMHLKNFSLIARGDRVQLSPAYDLVNTTIALPGATEELALPLRGKKRRITREDLLVYYAREQLGLEPRVVDDILGAFALAAGGWDRVVESSFLPEGLKKAYAGLIEERRSRLGV